MSILTNSHHLPEDGWLSAQTYQFPVYSPAYDAKFWIGTLNYVWLRDDNNIECDLIVVLKKRWIMMMLYKSKTIPHYNCHELMY